MEVVPVLNEKDVGVHKSYLNINFNKLEYMSYRQNVVELK